MGNFAGHSDKKILGTAPAEGMRNGEADILPGYSAQALRSAPFEHQANVGSPPNAFKRAVVNTNGTRDNIEHGGSNFELQHKATRIRLLDFTTPQMRAFHMSWFAFFLCFFAWFGIAPLMKVVREELALTQDQIGWCIIGSVAITVIARLIIGWLCDRIGPRLAYTWLLLIGSVPVMPIGFADDYRSFLLFRIAIGAIGASFVITQYHTSIMFAPNCVGTANATSAGWGNLGGA